jgi:hypothetical protein
VFPGSFVLHITNEFQLTILKENIMNSEKITIRIPKELLSKAKISAITVDCKLSAFVRLALAYSVAALIDNKPINYKQKKEN